MLIQAIGVLLGIIGFFTNITVILIIGGFLCLITDVIGYYSGKLNPALPIILYIGGYFIVGSWVGILYGSIIGNAIEAIPYILGLLLMPFMKTKK